MELQIAQYNTHKAKNKVMAPLLGCKRIRDIDVLAVQEPWQNPHMKATYCPRSSQFSPAYPKEFRSRACFLINKRLALADWTVEHPCQDLAVLTLRLRQRTVTISNVYSPPPGSLYAEIPDSAIHQLPSILSR